MKTLNSMYYAHKWPQKTQGQLQQAQVKSSAVRVPCIAKTKFVDSSCSPATPSLLTPGAVTDTCATGCFVFMH